MLWGIASVQKNAETIGDDPQNTNKIALHKPKTTDKLMVARATLCLGFFEFEFSLQASVHNGLVCLAIILVCMLQNVCSVL